MKFSAISFLIPAALFLQALATPAPTTSVSAAKASASTCVLHCGGPHGLDCPRGYRCCGPIILGVGGTCLQGATGICPL